MTVVGIAALVLAILIMLTTTPVGIGPLGVTAWFLLVLVGLAAVVGVVAYGLAAWLQPHATTKHRIKASWRRGLMIGGYITIVVALNSLQQLNLRAVLILALLLVLIEFYSVARA
jgi:hypothetical protein